MKFSTFLFASALVLLPTAAAADVGFAARGGATARIDFQVKIPPSLRLGFAPLENAASGARSLSIDAVARVPADVLAGAGETARRFAMSVASNLGHVTLTATLKGHDSVLRPRSRSGLVQYRGIVTGANSAGAIPTAAAKGEQAASPRGETYVVTAP